MRNDGNELEEQTGNEQYFRGTWIPKELWTCREQGKIDTLQFMLLLLIGKLNHPKHGCFASNEVLGKMLEPKKPIHPNSISRMIKRLKELGLVHIGHFDGHRRHVWTIWDWSVVKGGAAKERRSPSLNPSDDAALTLGLRPITRIKNNNSRNLHRGGVLSLLGDTTTSKERLSQTTKLYQSLLAKQLVKRGSSPTSWDSYLRRALSQFPDFDHVFNWYCTHVGEPYVPHAYSGKAFLQKYAAIKAAMKRGGEELPPHPRTKETIYNLMLDPTPQTKADVSTSLHELKRLYALTKGDDRWEHFADTYGFTTEFFEHWIYRNRGHFKRFTLTHPAFARWVQQWAEDMGYEAPTAEKMMGVLHAGVR